MFDRIGLATPPCGAPLSVAFQRQSSRYPALRMWLISRSSRPSWIPWVRIDSMTWWSRLPKQSEMSPSMNQCVPFQTPHHLVQGGVASAAGAEPVGMIGKLDVVVRLQQQAHYLGDDLVRPGRQAQRPRPSILLWNVEPLNRSPSVAQCVDDCADLLQGHAV